MATDFKTSDLRLGAYLLAKGVTLAGHNRGPGGVTFYFPNDSTTQSLVLAFMGDAEAPAMSLFRWFESLRTIIKRGH